MTKVLIAGFDDKTTREISDAVSKWVRDCEILVIGSADIEKNTSNIIKYFEKFFHKRTMLYNDIFIMDFDFLSNMEIDSITLIFDTDIPSISEITAIGSDAPMRLIDALSSILNSISSIICVEPNSVDLAQHHISNSKYNINDYILKPINYDELQLCVSRILSYVHLSKQLSNFKTHHEDDTYIVHSIQFSPEHHQAGIGILNYFGSIVHQKYPNENISVRIEQEGLTVRMVIETPEGVKERVEQTLADYGLVLAKKMTPEAFISDPYQVMQLKYKLELAQTELRWSRDLFQITQRNYEGRIASLESETQFLRGLVGTALQDTRDDRQMLQPLLERLSSQHHEAVTQALTTLTQVADRGIKASDEQAVKTALATIRRYEPDAFDKWADFFRGVYANALGNLLAQWVMSVVR